MKRDFVNYQGQKKAVDCLGCARERGEITIGGIVQTAFFDAHQDFEIPISSLVKKLNQYARSWNMHEAI